MTIHVVRPGLLTTVQDGGRFGWQSRGIGPGGAMDPGMLRVANLLVGNEPAAAALEVTLIGPVLRVIDDALIAVCGGAFPVAIGGEPVPHGRAVFVRGATEVTVGSCTSGCRAIVAVAGGIDVPIILDSRSTNLRAHFGGFAGRALRAGDVIDVGVPSPEGRHVMARLGEPGRRWNAERTGLARELLTRPDRDAAIRMIPGAAFGTLSGASQAALLGESFRVSARSDRMGYRLEGPALELTARREMTSEGVAWGTIQLPPDGQPIVLLADRQTTGGYPVVGHVATADRGLLAQRKPGDEIRFMTTTLEEAQLLLAAHERTIIAARHALSARRAGEDG